MSAPAARGRLDRGLARLVAVRKLMKPGDPRRSPDYGRADAKAWVQRFSPSLPDSVRVRRLNASCPGHEVKPRGNVTRTLLYVHGGGLVHYDTAVFLPFLAILAAESGLRVVALDYPKAPEVATSEILLALTRSVSRALKAMPDQEILIGGDSVGGLLAMHFALGRFRERFSEIHLIYPVLDAPDRYRSPYAEGHFLDEKLMLWFRGFIDPLFEIALEDIPVRFSRPRLRRLPAVTLHVAECDILREEGLRFGERCRRAGVHPRIVEHETVPHDFCLYTKPAPSAAASVRQIAAALGPERRDLAREHR